MSKRKIGNKGNTTVLVVICIILVVGIVGMSAAILYIDKFSNDNRASGIEKIEDADSDDDNTKSDKNNNSEEKEDTDLKEEEKKEVVSKENTFNAAGRPSFLSKAVTLEKLDIAPTVEEYTVESDLSNIYNKELFYFNEDETKHLVDDHFFVYRGGAGFEFFEKYETNRYYYEPNFVTVDSLMHTYHLYFSHLLKSTEKEYLYDTVSDISIKMLDASMDQYDELKDTEWEEAAKRNVEFFSVAAGLTGNDVDAFSDVVDVEISKINEADGIYPCEILEGSEEDYSQYKPRGYYDADERLQKYFKTMMWYGRIQFNTNDDDMIRSAVLMNIAINDSCLREWMDVYDITTFFVGSSDDLGFYEYYPVIQEVYGSDLSLDNISKDTEKFNQIKNRVSNLSLPAINSIPIDMGEDNVIQGFRFMGQRFTVDAAVMQKLIYSDVDKNSNGELRMLPDVLDITAALGSDIAYDLLKENKDTEFKNYTENMDKMREELSSETGVQALGTNLYGNWLSTLRPLLTKKGEGYPPFMQSDNWAKKDLECFAGSYTELKHDTVLYAKQVMAEMGDGEIPEFDDRGYVQPEPMVFSRFAYLADATLEGLKERNKLSKEDEEGLKKLSELAISLKEMSVKELNDEVLTDEEYDMIREYGGTLEHFWYDVTKRDTGDDDINTEKYPAALVVDIATDPNGQALELGTGSPNAIYVVVKVDGKIKVATGTVYDFYQFPWPLSDRLTDTKWREMKGIEPGADGFTNYERKDEISNPWWTESYSYRYVYSYDY